MTRAQFEVEIHDRVRSVSVEAVGGVDPGGGRFRVLVDGRPFELTALPTNLGLSLVMAGDGQVIDAALTKGRAGEWLVQLPHVAVTAVVDGRRARPGAAADEAGTGQRRVTAPMPGRVVRVLVQPGDEVAARQGLVVVEAMKMENELGSPKAGRVVEVAVSEGMSIEAGRLLIVVE